MNDCCSGICLWPAVRSASTLLSNKRLAHKAGKNLSSHKRHCYARLVGEYNKERGTHRNNLSEPKMIH